MIGWISGTLRFRSGQRLTVDVGGVGYDLAVTEAAAEAAGPLGSAVEFFVHTHVREDLLDLYGFASAPERELFLHLLSVSGIGPKTALAILSAVPSDRLVSAIRAKNLGLLQSVPGIGKKSAERLVVELQDRLKGFVLPTDGARLRGLPETPVAEEVLSALENLGYKRPTAEAALARVDLSNFTTFDRILKESLKLLSRGT